MRILLVSHAFPPSVGGLETVSLTLAAEFSAAGHEVCVVTQTPGREIPGLSYRVVRHPGAMELLRLTRWCDVMFHNNISLQMVWPLVFVRRPWVVAHHTWIPRGRGVRGLKGALKRFVLRWARCISISNAIAAHVPAPSVVVPNPYDDGLFRNLGDDFRQKDLVFVGRLVSDKGVDLLLQSMSMIRKRHGLSARLSIIGDGPEESMLRALTAELQLEHNVSFLGRLQGETLVRELNAHRILVVPSRWNEPFGVVALEGIACGCVVVGSRGGGLQDAIGRCGLTFPNGDAESLAECLWQLLANPERLRDFRAHATSHLANHNRKHVASAYLKILETAVV